MTSATRILRKTCTWTRGTQQRKEKKGGKGKTSKAATEGAEETEKEDDEEAASVDGGAAPAGGKKGKKEKKEEKKKAKKEKMKKRKKEKKEKEELEEEEYEESEPSELVDAIAGRGAVKKNKKNKKTGGGKGNNVKKGPATALSIPIDDDSSDEVATRYEERIMEVYQDSCRYLDTCPQKYVYISRWVYLTCVAVIPSVYVLHANQVRTVTALDNFNKSKGAVDARRVEQSGVDICIVACSFVIAHYRR